MICVILDNNKNIMSLLKRDDAATLSAANFILNYSTAYKNKSVEEKEKVFNAIARLKPPLVDQKTTSTIMLNSSYTIMCIQAKFFLVDTIPYCKYRLGLSRLFEAKLQFYFDFVFKLGREEVEKMAVVFNDYKITIDGDGLYNQRRESLIDVLKNIYELDIGTAIKYRLIRETILMWSDAFEQQDYEDKKKGKDALRTYPRYFETEDEYMVVIAPPDPDHERERGMWIKNIIRIDAKKAIKDEANPDGLKQRILIWAVKVKDLFRIKYDDEGFPVGVRISIANWGETKLSMVKEAVHFLHEILMAKRVAKGKFKQYIQTTAKNIRGIPVPQMVTNTFTSIFNPIKALMRKSSPLPPSPPSPSKPHPVSERVKDFSEIDILNQSEQESDEQASDDQASEEQASDDQASDDQASEEQASDEQASEEDDIFQDTSTRAKEYIEILRRINKNLRLSDQAKSVSENIKTTYRKKDDKIPDQWENIYMTIGSSDMTALITKVIKILEKTDILLNWGELGHCSGKGYEINTYDKSWARFEKCESMHVDHCHSENFCEKNGSECVSVGNIEDKGPEDLFKGPLNKNQEQTYIYDPRF